MCKYVCAYVLCACAYMQLTRVLGRTGQRMQLIFTVGMRANRHEGLVQTIKWGGGGEGSSDMSHICTDDA